MNEFEFDAIEEQLGVVLPMAYKDAVCNYQFDREKVFLWSNASRLMNTNLNFRTGGFGGFSWPSINYTFGHDGAGNHFFFDISEPSLHVFIIDHETHEISQVCDDFRKWLAHLST